MNEFVIGEDYYLVDGGKVCLHAVVDGKYYISDYYTDDEYEEEYLGEKRLVNAIYPYELTPVNHDKVTEINEKTRELNTVLIEKRHEKLDLEREIREFERLLKKIDEHIEPLSRAYKFYKNEYKYFADLEDLKVVEPRHASNRTCRVNFGSQWDRELEAYMGYSVDCEYSSREHKIIPCPSIEEGEKLLFEHCCKKIKESINCWLFERLAKYIEKSDIETPKEIINLISDRRNKEKEKSIKENREKIEKLQKEISKLEKED